ncbi:hypothetical protein SeLEV6574_g07528 [Synchytrium endobioticum]|uniref:Cas12f1-like TNB domain-containing protein n=2 Tax=Synchytrium endobioticum TaxID=286115 RepID=A0A507CKH2_9FUNG|nr:hypothetical protein SeLEV6574_g07528 [Synchytrium endobioticum]
MGIKYFWKYLTSLNVVKEKLGSVDSKQFLEVTGDVAPKGVPGWLKGVGGKGGKGRTYVDILGCFYTEIIRCVELGHLRGHICIDQKETIARRINDAVGIVNRARTIAERATEMLIDGRVRFEHLPILEKVEALWGEEFLENLSWPDSNIKILMLTVLMKKVAADIDTVFSNQIVGMLPLLKERVVEVVGEEGKQAIEEIEAWVDASLEDDSSSPPPVQVVYKVNRLYQAPARPSKRLREMAGVGPKATKMATRAAFMKTPSKGRLLEEVFLLPPEMLVTSRYVLDDSPRRYVRTPSFKTNGLVLSLLWIDTTSKPPPPDRKVEDTINLPNIFHNKTLRSTHKDAWIIATDPGATCIAGAVAYDPNHPDQRRNLAVTTKCLAEPERRYRDWLEADKPEAIYSAERDCTKSDQETWPVFLQRFVTSYDIAHTYYSSTKYKRKRWDADNAKRGELDRVLEGIVNMVDESMGHKLSDGKKVIVAIGMGDFSSTQSRHGMFIRYLIQLRPLGYAIVGVNEYFTSKKCPCCQEFVEMPTMKRLYCRGCNKWYHRDVMAADNMVSIVRGYLEHDERPTYLKPPSKDKNTPMKRKADEGGTSRGGPSKSRKTR